MKRQLTFIDLCAGIGGFRCGLENAGLKCVGFAEFNEPARRSYQAMYDTTNEWTARDINDLKSDDIPYADIWTFGFPCQDISTAGTQRGLAGSRSGLFYKIIDLVKGKKEDEKPRLLIIENVKHLLGIHNGWDFAKVLSEMAKAGYDAEWQLVNSKNFGVPQSRERVYIIGILRTGKFRGQKILPVRYSSQSNQNKYSRKRDQGKFITVRDANFCYTDNPWSRLRKPNQPIWTIACTSKHAVYYLKSGKIRYLTPRECFRLQGFSDELFNRANSVNDDKELYRQAGNAVTVNIPREIGKKIVKCWNRMN